MNWIADNRRWFEPYVRDMADRMGLRDWKINVLDEEPEEDAGAQCKVVYGRKVANLKFRVPSSPEELRHFVVHELLHCHSALLDWNANGLQPAMSPQTFDVWHGGFEDAVELMTDGIAMAWMQMLPLPLYEIVITHGSQGSGMNASADMQSGRRDDWLADREDFRPWKDIR